MTNTLPRENWGLTEIADRWSAGEVLRQQIFGAETEKMLELASVERAVESLMLRPVRVSKRCPRHGRIDQSLKDEVTRLVKNVPGVTEVTKMLFHSAGCVFRILSAAHQSRSWFSLP